MTVSPAARMTIPCDGTELVVEPVLDTAGRRRLQLVVVLNPHRGGYLRITVARLLPRQAAALAGALETLIAEVRDA